MIQHTHLTAWQAHAPWPKRSQIEQDLHAWHLSEAGSTPYPVDGAKAMDAFSWYLEKEGTRLGRNGADALLHERLRKPSFRRDMDTLLRPGLPKFDVDEGAAAVRAAYFKHLKP